MIEKWKQLNWRNKTLWGIGIGVIVFVITIIGLSLFLNSKNMGWETLSMRKRTIHANTVVFDNNGLAWIGALDGLYTYDGNTLLDYDEINLEAPDNDIEALAIDPLGRIWAGTDGAVHVFDGKHWITYAAHNSPLRGELVKSIAFDTLGRAWIGTYNGILVFTDESWTHLTSENSPLASNMVWVITFDQQGRAWIGTWSGLNVFEGQDIFEAGNWKTYYTAQENISGEFAGDIIEDNKDILIDEHGTAWIGYRDGIKMYDGDNWMEYSSQNPFDPIQRVSAIDIDPNGHIYIINPNDYMVVLSEQEEIIYDQRNSGLPGMFKEVALDPKGNVWIVGYSGIKIAKVDDSGLPHRISLDDNQFELIIRIRGLLIYSGIGLLFLWILFYLNDLFVPLAALAVTAVIWITIQNFNGSWFIIPILGGIIGGVFGRIIGGFIMKLRKKTTIIRRTLTIIGSIIGFILVLVGFFFFIMMIG